MKQEKPWSWEGFPQKFRFWTNVPLWSENMSLTDILTLEV